MYFYFKEVAHARQSFIQCCVLDPPYCFRTMQSKKQSKEEKISHLHHDIKENDGNMNLKENEKEKEKGKLRL